MTHKDIKLIAEATSLGWQEWPKISDMEHLAETEQAKTILREMAVRGYHREEAFAGII